jgi:hypothetical protein
MSNLFGISKQIVGDCVDPNINFLFDLSSLISSQAWNDFNDVNKDIFHHPIVTENIGVFLFFIRVD